MEEQAPPKSSTGWVWVRQMVSDLQLWHNYNVERISQFFDIDAGVQPQRPEEEIAQGFFSAAGSPRQLEYDEEGAKLDPEEARRLQAKLSAAEADRANLRQKISSLESDNQRLLDALSKAEDAQASLAPPISIDQVKQFDEMRIEALSAMQTQLQQLQQVVETMTTQVEEPVDGQDAPADQPPKMLAHSVLLLRNQFEHLQSSQLDYLNVLPKQDTPAIAIATDTPKSATRKEKGSRQSGWLFSRFLQSFGDDTASPTHATSSDKGSHLVTQDRPVNDMDLQEAVEDGGEDTDYAPSEATNADDVSVAGASEWEGDEPEEDIPEEEEEERPSAAEVPTASRAMRMLGRMSVKEDPEGPSIVDPELLAEADGGMDRPSMVFEERESETRPSEATVTAAALGPVAAAGQEVVAAGAEQAVEPDQAARAALEADEVSHEVKTPPAVEQQEEAARGSVAVLVGGEAV